MSTAFDGTIPPAGGTAELLMRQASMTAYTYMRAAVDDIDAMFGAGYAKAHPELVGDFMKTAAMDFGACFIANKLDEMQECLRTDHPLQGETFDGITAAIEELAETCDRIADAIPSE